MEDMVEMVKKEEVEEAEEMGGDGGRGMLMFMLGIAFAFFINDMEKYRDEIDKVNGVYYKKERNRWKEMYDEVKKLYGED